MQLKKKRKLSNLLETDLFLKVDARFWLVAVPSTLLVLVLFLAIWLVRLMVLSVWFAVWALLQMGKFAVGSPVARWRSPPMRAFGSKAEAIVAWFWGIALARGAHGMKVVVIGKKPRGRRPFVIVANHSSMIDISALFVALRGMDFRFVAAKELFRMPVFGWAMWLCGHISFDRRNVRSMVETYGSLGERCFRYGQSVAVFPEGTRSAEIAEFGDSIFTRAIREEVDVLPIRLIYSEEGTRVDVIIGNVISVEGRSRTGGAQLSDDARQQIVDASVSV